MTTRSAVLVLFDIDGTLIRTAGAGARGLSEAIARLHGRRDALAGVPVSGRTDRAILDEVFRRWGGVLTDDAVGPLRDAYIAALVRELQSSSEPGVGVLPGVEAVLDAVRADVTLAPGLLTGNFERGAEAKLMHFNLWHRFNFGAFGDHHADRRALVPIAVDRARAVGIEATDIIVIGDTPLDVDCAHAFGARAIAVATGEYSFETLTETGAEVVVHSLEALQPVVATVARLCGTPRRPPRSVGMAHADGAAAVPDAG